MTSSYSARSRAIEPFHVMALLARANELQASGHDVIHLEIGEPDFTTAEPIVAAGQAALAAGHTRYTAARGLPQLREAIAGFYRQRYQLSIDPERVLITPGGSGALLLASLGGVAGKLAGLMRARRAIRAEIDALSRWIEAE